MLGFDGWQLVFIAAATLTAFVVRGLSGFGSSVIGVGALSLLLPPAQVVPAFLAIELLTTINLLPSVWRQIDWRSLRWVIAGCAVATLVMPVAGRRAGKRHPHGLASKGNRAGHGHQRRAVAGRVAAGKLLGAPTEEVAPAAAQPHVAGELMGLAGARLDPPAVLYRQVADQRPLPARLLLAPRAVPSGVAMVPPPRLSVTRLLPAPARARLRTEASAGPTTVALAAGLISTRWGAPGVKPKAPMPW